MIAHFRNTDPGAGRSFLCRIINVIESLLVQYFPWTAPVSGFGLLKKIMATAVEVCWSLITPSLKAGVPWHYFSGQLPKAIKIQKYKTLYKYNVVIGIKPQSVSAVMT
jgi:hypothetical protein